MNEIDWIRRSEVIEVLENTDWYHQNANKDMVRGANSNEHQAWYKAEDVYKALESVPSAQLEIIRCKDILVSPMMANDFCSRAERRTDGMAERKMIYLDDALDILDDLQIGYENGFNIYADSRKRMLDLPFAQPECKTGKWVGEVEYCKHLEETTGERYQPSSFAGMIYCNQCWTGSDRKSNYCRSCGADMRVEEV